MRSELQITPHSVVDGAFVIEVWHDGQFIATVTGSDGPGVRVISKYPLDEHHRYAGALSMVEVKVQV